MVRSAQAQSAHKEAQRRNAIERTAYTSFLVFIVAAFTAFTVMMVRTSHDNDKVNEQIREVVSQSKDAS